MLRSRKPVSTVPPPSLTYSLLPDLSATVKISLRLLCVSPDPISSDRDSRLTMQHPLAPLTSTVYPARATFSHVLSSSRSSTSLYSYVLDGNTCPIPSLPRNSCLRSPPAADTNIHPTRASLAPSSPARVPPRSPPASISHMSSAYRCASYSVTLALRPRVRNAKGQVRVCTVLCPSRAAHMSRDTPRMY